MIQDLLVDSRSRGMISDKCSCRGELIRNALRALCVFREAEKLLPALRARLANGGLTRIPANRGDGELNFN